MPQRLFTIFVALCFAGVNAQEAVRQPLSDFFFEVEDSEYSYAGLEVTNPEIVPVLIEGLGQEAYDLGITTIQLREWMRPRFSQVDLEYEEAGDDPDFRYLYVQLEVAGGAFSIDLNFDRQVYFDANGVPNATIASTWKKGLVGLHNSDISFVQSSLEQLLDMFFNDYLASNDL